MFMSCTRVSTFTSNQLNEKQTTKESIVRSINNRNEDARYVAGVTREIEIASKTATASEYLRRHTKYGDVIKRCNKRTHTQSHKTNGRNVSDRRVGCPSGGRWRLLQKEACRSLASKKTFPGGTKIGFIFFRK
jgi:hypothetical protein